MKTARFFWLLILMIGLQTTYGQARQNNSDTTLKNLDPVKAEKAKSIVASYARLFFNGENIDSLASLCSLPFAWDRKKIIETWPDFKKEQQLIIDQKGKNSELVIDSVFVAAIRSEMLDKVVPVNIYYVIVTVKFNREGKERSANALFAVQISEQPKIVGFSD